jgi:hypothetical protein
MAEISSTKRMFAISAGQTLALLQQFVGDRLKLPVPVRDDGPASSWIR